jgi:hypothetical protein
MLKTKLPLIALTATLLTGCCLEDHTKTIRKVAEPMFKELEAFYKTNKRFPNTKERDEMLEKAGCKMKGDICMFEGEELTITKSGKTYGGNSYRVRIEFIDKSINNIYKQSLASCGFGVYESGYQDFVICTKRPCIEIRQ